MVFSLCFSVMHGGNCRNIAVLPRSGSGSCSIELKLFGAADWVSGYWLKCDQSPPLTVNMPYWTNELELNSQFILPCYIRNGWLVFESLVKLKNHPARQWPPDWCWRKVDRVVVPSSPANQHTGARGTQGREGDRATVIWFRLGAFISCYSKFRDSILKISMAAQTYLESLISST